jgi:hypothetical protein
VKHYRLAASGWLLTFLLAGCSNQPGDQACLASIAAAHDLNPALLDTASEGLRDCLPDNADSTGAREGHQNWIKSQAPAQRPRIPPR